MRSDLNLSVTDILDLHDVAEVSDTAVNLDLVLKELLEGGDVEDLVACGLRSVDDELCSGQRQSHFPGLNFTPHAHYMLEQESRRGGFIPCG